jgi:exopolysaccharide biosynthesis predicted pyruvyltransferase EpsI
MAHVPGARFCHDMAFFLDLPPITPVAAQGRFFRTDRESLGQGLPEGNRDISFEGTEVTPIQGFFDAIGQFETVHTDRLHVAIVAALLGRRTHLYANGYHKNAAIFRSSLAPFYPNVSYHEFREV